MARLRAHASISGRVQGVFFRSWTKKTAEALGLDGWVRNLSDGRVEVVFEGDRKKIEEMLQRCEEGLGVASVENLEVHWEETKNLKGFKIKPTK